MLTGVKSPRRWQATCEAIQSDTGPKKTATSEKKKHESKETRKNTVGGEAR